MRYSVHTRYPFAAALAAALLLSHPVARAQEAAAAKAAEKKQPARQKSAALDAAAVKQKLAVPVVFTDGVKTAKRTRGELGLKVVSLSPVRLRADRARLKQALAKAAPAFKAAPVDAKPYTYKGQFHLSPGRHARALNVPTTAELFARAIEKDAGTTRWRVTLKKTPPRVSTEMLKGINGVLASFKTTASGSQNRDANISLSVQRIDGTVLSPGETFSLNQAVGKRTRASGFQAAPVFVDAEKVPGLGGGVSQVTGTLFNAAALAGLKIDEVNPHSRPVSYLPLGRDATVAYGSKDLKFTNTTGAPVYITYTFDGTTLAATFFGKKTPGEQISLRPNVQRLGPGKINAQLYRVVKQDGKVIAKSRLFSHAYRWKPE
ncbi:MAG TPA: VanW family protein [Armatimonadaceae bacterium]|nr:VanW family protein [Armatimonadaceae bacterium]